MRLPQMTLKCKATICMAVLIMELIPNRTTLCFNSNPQDIKYMDKAVVFVHSRIKMPTLIMFSIISMSMLSSWFWVWLHKWSLVLHRFWTSQNIKSYNSSKVSIIELWKWNERVFNFSVYFHSLEELVLCLESMSALHKCINGIRFSKYKANILINYRTRFGYKSVCSRFIITHYVTAYKTIHIYYLKKSHDSLNRSCD